MDVTALAVYDDAMEKPIVMGEPSQESVLVVEDRHLSGEPYRG